MPKHDPPGDDAALLELERELMELDRAIRAAEENREAIDYALFDRRGELMVRIFNTPAAGLAGLAVQARAYLSEYEVEFAEGVAYLTGNKHVPRLDFARWGHLCHSTG